jgi:hypothetical protein
VKPFIIAVAVAGTVATVSIQVRAQLRMRDAEKAAAAALSAIVDAQRAFRKAGGRGGYATDLQSLIQPCAGAPATLSAPPPVAADDYRVVLRAAQRASPVGTDCHGRPTASDFYAAVQPAHEWAGRQAMASTAWGRIYVFFDGLPPVERDMDAGGLAVPLDTLDSFKIP